MGWTVESMLSVKLRKYMKIIWLEKWVRKKKISFILEGEKKKKNERED